MKLFTLEKDSTKIPFALGLCSNTLLDTEVIIKDAMERLALVKTRFNGYDSWSRLNGTLQEDTFNKEKTNEYKYIVFESSDSDRSLTVVFSKRLVHKDVAESLAKITRKLKMGMKPKRAGFCHIESKLAYGESETLNISSDTEKDSALITRLFKATNNEK